MNSILLFAQNEKYELEELVFEGNEYISTPELESVINAKESPNWFAQFLNSFTGFGSEAIMFDSTNVTNDIAALKNYYFNRGYFQADIKAKYQLDASSKEATLKFIINEKTPSYFGELEVSGLEEIPKVFSKDINRILSIDTNAIYNTSEIEKINKGLIEYLKTKGMMLAYSKNTLVTIDTLKRKVSVNLDIDTGLRYKISDIRVTKTGEGADHIDESLLKEIVEIKSGDGYNLYDLQRGQARLYRTNLFNSATVSSVVADTSGHNVPLSISASVGPLNEISPEFILNNEDDRLNIGLGIGYSKKNFLGGARKLTLSASAAAQNILEFLQHPVLSDTAVLGFADFRASIEQPFLFGEVINTRFENYITLQKRKNEWNATLIGSKITLDFELPKKVYLSALSTSFNFEHSKYFFWEKYLYDIFYKALKANPALTEEERIKIAKEQSGSFPVSKRNIGILGVDLLANKTDDFLFPTEGYSLSIMLQDGNALPYLASKIFNFPFEEVLYYKVMFSGTGFIPVFPTKDNSLGSKFIVGLIQEYKGEISKVPFNQRFYSGGSNSVRGWSSRELAPNQPSINLETPSPEELENLFLKNLTSGGFFVVEGSIETRNRLIGNLGSAFFIDYGNTFIDKKDFRFDRIAIAAGLGLRYYSDIVPIRFDFGFKVYDPNSKTNYLKKKFVSDFLNTLQFHLGIGEAF